jgi:hypothetical protein
MSISSRFRLSEKNSCEKAESDAALWDDETCCDMLVVMVVDTI